MKSYSEDLRRKIVAAVERSMSKTEAARLFDVSLSSVKRILKDGPSGELSRSKEETRQDSKGRREGQEATQRRHERAPRCDHRREDSLPTEHHGRAPELLHHPAVVETPGMEPKKRSVGAAERDEWLRAAWRVTLAQHIDPERFVFVDEMGAHTSLSSIYAYSPKGQRAYCSVPRNRGPNTTLL